MATRRDTYVALLRGINLGSRNRVAMADLRALVEGLGGRDVSTYLQSGNVVFRSAGDLAGAIEAGLARDLGVEARVLLRTRAQLLKVVRANPFSGAEKDVTKLHVTFLERAPANGRLGDVDAEGSAPDELRIVRREAYLRCPNGYGRTKLTNAYLERKLGTAATTRNWKTVTKLAELASA